MNSNFILDYSHLFFYYNQNCSNYDKIYLIGYFNYLENKRYIPLRNKHKKIIAYAIVDNKYFDELNKYKWNKSNYVNGIVNKKNWSLHGYIIYHLLKNKKDNNFVIDHINNNSLDNRIKNLRLVTHEENNRNKSKARNTSSKYYGVSYIKRDKKWRVGLKINEKNLSAYFEIEEHAAYQYNLWIKENKLNTAKLNNIEKPIDFIEWKKKETLGLPKYISKNGNNFKVNINKKYYGTFKTIEEAIIKCNLQLIKIKEEKENKIKNISLLKNDNKNIIIELFNKNKKKVAETIIDENKYYTLINYSWYLSNKGYPVGYVNGKTIQLSRYLMNYYGPNKVDHINGNPLDNRICNLRIVTPQQNNMNRASRKNSSSKYIGVSWDRKSKKWASEIKVEGKKIYIGLFNDEIDAAKARDEATKKYFGEYGRLNFPEGINT